MKTNDLPHSLSQNPCRTVPPLKLSLGKQINNDHQADAASRSRRPWLGSVFGKRCTAICLNKFSRENSLLTGKITGNLQFLLRGERRPPALQLAHFAAEPAAQGKNEQGNSRATLGIHSLLMQPRTGNANSHRYLVIQASNPHPGDVNPPFPTRFRGHTANLLKRISSFDERAANDDHEPAIQSAHAQRNIPPHIDQQRRAARPQHAPHSPCISRNGIIVITVIFYAKGKKIGWWWRAVARKRRLPPQSKESETRMMEGLAASLIGGAMNCLRSETPEN